MGVIRNNSGLFNSSNTVEDDWILLSSDGDDHPINQNQQASADQQRSLQSAEQSIHLQLKARRAQRRPPRVLKPNGKPEPTFTALGAKGKSHKKARRYDNATQIMGNLVNEQDLETISITDFVPAKTSPFAMLRKLQSDQLIDDFIECNDEDHCHANQSRRTFDGLEYQLESCTLLDELELDDPELNVDSGRCFYRIQSNIRRQLVNKHTPLGILANIESEIVPFFQSTPTSMCQLQMAGSYQRLLLHAVCQYLNLHCQSIDHGGRRLSVVKNKKSCFHQPTQMLSDYLRIIH